MNADPEQEDAFIQELCLANGLESGKSDYGDVERLEIFLSSIQTIPVLVKFSHLKTLCFLGIPLHCIENLECLPCLSELWIIDCKLSKIGGLDCNEKLQKLYLYGNGLCRIEGLDKLTDLQVLWLNGNKIKCIEGMSQLTKLRELNLAENMIMEIGTSLTNNTLLESVNLSGNKIEAFKELVCLTTCRHLKHLSLKDPLYSPCPVAHLCNYSTFALYHFPYLLTLDTCDVSCPMLKDLSEETVRKKQSYYQMTQRSILRKYSCYEAVLQSATQRLVAPNSERIRKLYLSLKETERQLSEPCAEENKAELARHDSSNTSEEQLHNEVETCPAHNVKLLETKRDLIRIRIEELEESCKRCQSVTEEAIDVISTQQKDELACLNVEHQSGGNIQFEEGTKATPWFLSCQDLVQSRFCAADFKDLGVTGLKVQRVVRLQNRILKRKFDINLQQVKQEEGYEETSTKEDAMDYLFYVWDPSLPQSCNEKDRVLEQGFRSPQTYQQWGCHGALHVTNSVNISDKPRIKALLKEPPTSGTLSEKPSLRYGRLILCKTFVGKSAQVNHHKRILASQFPGCHTAFKLRRHSLSLLRSRSNEVLQSARCDCNSRRSSYYLFNPELALPEYIIYVEYITKNTPHIYNNLSLLFQSNNSTPSTAINSHHVSTKMTTDGSSTRSDDDVILSHPIVASRPRLTVLTEDALLKHCRASFAAKITSVNLVDSGLSKIQQLAMLGNLKEIIGPFNGLTHLKDITGMISLTRLDVSFNQIATLAGFKCDNLTDLNVSWNCLTQTREEITSMGKHLPMLSSLDTTHNPWMKPNTLRNRCIGRLRHLTMLDNLPVTELEISAAMRTVACSRIAHVTILANSRTDKSRPRMLSVISTVSLLMATSALRPAQLHQEDKVWLSMVTCLFLDEQHLSKLSNLDQLLSLKWASFNGNDISRIEGLSGCTALEELSLSDNNISRLEGINLLVNLKHLNLNRNKISSLEASCLDLLSSLQVLLLDGNKLNSLKGVEGAKKLRELYVADNEISTSLDIFHLKSNTALIIIDLFGNPITEETENYRLFAIYHLPSLKAIDSAPVEFPEAVAARDTFGGRLTQDFIAEQLNHGSFSEVTQLDLCGNSLTIVDLSPGNELQNLLSVNLEANNLTSFGGLIHLKQLKVLCLNHNRVESILPKRKPSPSEASYAAASGDFPRTGVHPTFTLQKLEVLHLGYNGISNIVPLQLERLPNLKALFLQGNELLKVDGLLNNFELRELVLDKNKIKCFSEVSFAGLKKLTELHVEENRLRTLANLDYAKNLERLYIGLNRLQDSAELEHLSGLSSLIEISLIGNSVTRRLQHRALLAFRLPSLLCIDGIHVTADERAQAEMYFVEQQNGLQLVQSLASGVDALLPGIQMSPLKVSTVRIDDSIKEWHPSGRRMGVDPFYGLSPPLHLNADISELAKGLGRSNPDARARYSVPYVPHSSTDAESSKQTMRHHRRTRKEK